MKLYLAGPLFTTAERAFNAELGARLKDLGHEIWLPQDHEPRAEGAAHIFAMDVEGMDWAEVIVANMDGPDPDSGTCWECGYVYKKKSIILYRTDFRAAGDAENVPYNLMMTESANVMLQLPLAKVEDIAAAIHKALQLPLAATSSRQQVQRA